MNQYIFMFQVTYPGNITYWPIYNFDPVPQGNCVLRYDCRYFL